MVFAVQFRFPQTACVGTNCFCSAFSVQQCQLKPYSQLVFNISFKTLGVCGERCRAGHSANQHVNAIEGSMNCSHSMCDTIHMTLEKKTSCTSVIVSSPCLHHHMRCFFLAFCDDSKQSSKQHTYSCLGNGFPHTYTHTAVTHLQHVLGESI